MPTRAKFITDRVGPLRDALFFYAQVPLLGSMAIAAVIATTSSDGDDFIEVLGLGILVAGVSIVALFLPWHRIARRWLVSIPVIDVLILAQLRADVIEKQPGLGILVLIPTLWLSYSFGAYGVIVAIVGDYLVALAANIRSGAWPGTPAAWGSATLLPAIVSLVAIAVYVAARQLEKRQADLVAAYEDLRVSIARRRDTESTALGVVNNVDAGITFYDPNGAILLTNDTARALVALGGGSADKVARSLLLFEGDRMTPIAPADQTVARAERGELDTNRTLWVGMGAEQRAVMVTSRHVRRATGELIGTLVATHDVTELTDAIRARDEFLTTVSHELRTPLTSMIGYLEVIEDNTDLAAAGIAAEFAVIQRNSQRLLSLINALLTEAEGQVLLKRRSEDITGLAARALDAVRTSAANAGVTLTNSSPAPVSAEVNEGEISDFLDKLLSNAVKFNRPGGGVSVNVRRDRDDVIVRVADTGLGIADLDQAHIFERFFRGAEARLGVIAGAGLGLSTAKVIVDSYQGTIAATSVESEGTTVEVRLPLAVA